MHINRHYRHIITMTHIQRIITLLILCSLTFIGNAQNVKELEQQRKNTLKQLETTGKMLNETKKNEKVTLNKLNIINRNISERKRLINDISTEIDALDLSMDSLRLQMTDLEAQLTYAKADYERLVQETHYALTNNNTPLLFILSADSFDKMYRRFRYLQEFSAYRKEQAKRIADLQNDITLRNQTLEQHRKSKQDVLQLREREHQKLTGDQRKQKQMLTQLKKKEKDLLAQQKKHQKKADELNNRIEKLIAEEIRKAEAKKKTTATTEKTQGKPSVTTLTKEETLIAGNFEKNKGRLPWPVEKGFVSGRYGIQPHPVLQHVTINNKGIYIQTPAKSDARAVFEGEVTQRFSIPGSNNAVIIKHGNYRTVYANLTEIYVKEGDKISPKQKIGRIYVDPENDNKTELYFQVWKDKTLENPSNWLAK